MVWQQEICNQGNLTYFLSLQVKQQLFFIHKMKSLSFPDYLFNSLLTTPSNKFPVCKWTSHLRCFLKIAAECRHLSSYFSCSSLNPRGFSASLVIIRFCFELNINKLTESTRNMVFLFISMIKNNLKKLQVARNIFQLDLGS